MHARPTMCLKAGNVASFVGARAGIWHGNSPGPFRFQLLQARRPHPGQPSSLDLGCVFPFWILGASRCSWGSSRILGMVSRRIRSTNLARKGLTVSDGTCACLCATPDQSFTPDSTAWTQCDQQRIPGQICNLTASVLWAASSQPAAQQNHSKPQASASLMHSASQL